MPASRPDSPVYFHRNLAIRVGKIKSPKSFWVEPVFSYPFIRMKGIKQRKKYAIFVDFWVLSHVE